MKKISQSQLISLIQDAINTNGAAITVDIESSSSTLIDWDSLAQLIIIQELDDMLGDPISELSELSEAKSVKAVIGVLRNHDLFE